jgi:phage terminase large subunit-like protein
MSASLYTQMCSDDPDGFIRWYAKLTPAQQLDFQYDWTVHGRPEQLTPPGDWYVWLALAGRGWGKTRTGGEFIIAEAKTLPGGRGALVGATGADVWDVMVHGESGILAKSHPNFLPVTYKRSVVWPNGFIATAYSAEEPDRLRGPQHHVFWADELAAWQYPETWDMLQFGLRLGKRPRGIVTTTPRPTPEIKALFADPMTVKSRGSTYENIQNLPEVFVKKIIARYEGTRLGEQELYAAILGDTPGALWKSEQIEKLRIRLEQLPDLVRICVAIDPAVSTKEGSAETGIVVVGIGPCMCKGPNHKPEVHGFVLEDATGERTQEDDPVHLQPAEWAAAACKAYRK